MMFTHTQSSLAPTCARQITRHCGNCVGDALARADGATAVVDACYLHGHRHRRLPTDTPIYRHERHVMMRDVCFVCVR